MTVSGLCMHADPPPACAEVNSLAFDDIDDEGGAAAAAATAEVGSGVEANEDEF